MRSEQPGETAIQGPKTHRNALTPGYGIHWFNIERVLGQGGFGITYLATDTNLHQQVAIKEFLPIDIAVREGDQSIQPVSVDHEELYAWGLERFMREARSLVQFDHPNIVRVLTVFEANNTAYIVMRYEEGDSLSGVLKKRKTLPEEELLDILLPILDGLELVHQAGFIHRDIKPPNIYLRVDGSPVLLDFGSARQALGEETQTLTTLVSPGFAPIEQYQSKSDQQGPWSDIYALAATIYRGITGMAPMDAVMRSTNLLANSPDKFVWARDVGGGRYSEVFLTAIDRGLQFAAGARPQSIAEWRQHLSALSQPASTMHRDAVTAEAIKTPTIELQRPEPRRKPSRFWKAFCVTLAMIVVSALVWNFLPTPGKPGQIAEIELGAEPEISEPDSAPAIPSAEPVADKVQRLLAEAEQAMRARRFTTPKDDNAFARYRQILQLDTDNQAARAGVRRILEIYVNEVLEADARDDFDAAERFLDQMLIIVPNSRIVPQAREHLRQRQLNIQQ